jgi:hypothetical protein
MDGGCTGGAGETIVVGQKRVRAPGVARVGLGGRLGGVTRRETYEQLRGFQARTGDRLAGKLNEPFGDVLPLAAADGQGGVEVVTLHVRAPGI